MEEVLEFLQILKKHAVGIMVFCVCAVITSFLLSYAVADAYESSTLILIKPHESLSLAGNTGQDTEILNFPISGGLFKPEVVANTYIEIIRSRAVAERVVRLLRWDVEEPQDTKGGFLAFLKPKLEAARFAAKQFARHGKVLEPPSPLEKAIEYFQQNISMAAIKDTYELEIRFSAESAQKAATAANVAATVFLEYMNEIRSPATQRALEYLEQRVGQSAQGLAAARNALRGFKESNRTIAFSEETSEEIRLVADLDSELEKTDARLAGLHKQFTPSNPKVRAVQAERDRLFETLSRRRVNVHALPDKERQLATLTADVAIAEEINTLIVKEFESARLRSGKREIELEPVSPAVAPLYPSQPIRLKYALVGFAVALVLGIAFVFAVESLDRSIRRVQDVEKVLQLRVLATLPPLQLTTRSR